MLNGRTELRIFDRGSVIGDRYCEEVLLPHVRLFRGAIGPGFIFMDDNARPHRTLAVEELLESEDITRMDWPAYSPDLNPIEHVWDALGRHIAARLRHPENTQQLKQMLIEEWALLLQEMLHQLVLSMRRRSCHFPKPLELENITDVIKQVLVDYDIRLRPNFGGKPLYIGMDLNIASFDSISEVNMGIAELDQRSQRGNSRQHGNDKSP
ncbi:transposable element Tcb2 transposase [Trichonephila clavipes]|uniref:Transposable element Tcb2 transposase n=1 Tax=Trichonephila clavipes TaxID=2585209 RepID=A0A8X6VIK7_TRICX|nr:transposable element Tcb2 transposase [Trichonephila clavipes]